ncbi:unnamed protein product [Prorocentrum cordatum]|uniref:Uncharacterized protein n=1 Tax=Prorocentrum cordatum TaxID=2364126 RepID=A0ABN9VKX1_9DINO|nr:unnamed protein product [Polarella glacialis]
MSGDAACRLYRERCQHVGQWRPSSRSRCRRSPRLAPLPVGLPLGGVANFFEEGTRFRRSTRICWAGSGTPLGSRASRPPSKVSACAVCSSAAAAAAAAAATPALPATGDQPKWHLISAVAALMMTMAAVTACGARGGGSSDVLPAMSAISGGRRASPEFR